MPPWSTPANHVFQTGETITAGTLNTFVQQNLALLGAGYGATIYQAGSQVVPGNAPTAIQFDTVENDPTGNMAHTGAFARITIPVYGVYQIDCGIQFTSPSTAGAFWVSPYVNAVELRRFQMQQFTSSVTSPALSGSTMRLCGVSDYIQMVAFQNAAPGGLNTSTGSVYTWMSVHLIGPN